MEEMKKFKVVIKKTITCKFDGHCSWYITTEKYSEEIEECEE